jgi:hypothetical protein
MTHEKLEKIELIARISSFIAIPFLIAVFGWLIQSRIEERSLSKEYVQIAVSILNSQEKSPEHNTLRDWAVEILVQNTPIKFSEQALHALQSGSPLNPIEVKVPISVPCIVDLPVSPSFITDEELKKLKDGNFVSALHVDRMKRQDYEAELEAVLIACRGTN